jgi:hypothetical protein
VNPPRDLIKFIFDLPDDVGDVGVNLVVKESIKLFRNYPS